MTVTIMIGMEYKFQTVKNPIDDCMYCSCNDGEGSFQR